MANKTITPMGFGDTVYKTDLMPYQGSSAWAGAGAVSFGTSILSNYMQLQSKLDQSEALEFRADRYKFKEKRARLAAEAFSSFIQVTACLMSSKSAFSYFNAVVVTPVPNGFVRMRTSPGFA